MCFGEKFEEKVITDVEFVQRPVVMNFIKFNMLNFIPCLEKVVFLWKELLEIQSNQENVLLPLVNTCRDAQRRKKQKMKDSSSLMLIPFWNLIYRTKRTLTDEEIVSLCSEFLLDAPTRRPQPCNGSWLT